MVGSATDAELRFDSDTSKVKVGYWYGKVVLKMS